MTQQKKVVLCCLLDRFEDEDSLQDVINEAQSWLEDKYRAEITVTGIITEEE